MAMTRAEAQRNTNYHYMADAMRMLEWDLHQRLMTELRIPAEWHQIAREKGLPGKTRVTLRLDEDIVRFFRSMGTNWQSKVNQVLSVWMHARLAGLINGGETMDYMKRREVKGHDGPRPKWGDLQQQADEVFGPGEFRDGPGVPMNEADARMPDAEKRAMLRGMMEARGLKWDDES
ncbi:BrnA antitoxin family protein [Paracoccus saliphilus]|uniref:BrnA antitoxin family protein n=1 Tax=Paracoccus saliphilus TaxID=405559 RepID=A0AA45W6U5_9RHOB|nr:BrnA antitoxin family protein [Paracoccus saliphilus]WCR03776.1 BrnA antitoxin family protein [Paracoccus saliphilus]SIT04565.1 BrnA antitoxin of type II toxin-antitoxin system [Paracoccus saliphilus]